MIYTNEELRKVQLVEVEMLKEVIRICEENDIEYFLLGGSVLGAVRHNGFIPWDDDVDVGMTRDNYNKFINIAPKKLSPQYCLQTPEAPSPYYYLKVRKLGTVFIEYCNKNIKMPNGIYLDVFPYDEVPDDEAANIAQHKKIQKLIKIFYFKRSPGPARKPVGAIKCIKAFIWRSLHYFLRIVPNKVLLNKLEKEFTKYNGTGQKALAGLNFPTIKTEYILKEDMFPLVKHKFEDIEAYIPKNYDTYLKTHYGNYMELPPEEQRCGHKPYKIDLGK